MPDVARPPHRSLAAHVLNRLGEAAQKVGFLRMSLDAGELIAEARERTGLLDFGGEAFREPLERLLLSCREEARLNIAGWLAIRHEIRQLLENRLFISDARQAKPSIPGTPVRAPIFILGLPRSGTTFLHSLLAQDSSNRAPLTWEAMYPSPRQGSPRQRISRASRNLALFAKLAPEFAAIHPIEALLPQECIALMSHSFLSDEFDTMFEIPGYARWLEQQDFTEAYEWHRRFLQHLQAGHDRRWVLKAPSHLATFAALRAAYPDARIVQTHRSPREVMGSLASLANTLRSTFTDAPVCVSSRNDLVPYWARALDRFARERKALPAASVCDVHFTEIRDSPMDAVQRVYAHFGLELSPEAEQRMLAFVRERQHRSSSPHTYSTDTLRFNTEETSVFADYCARHCVREPTPSG